MGDIGAWLATLLSSTHGLLAGFLAATVAAWRIVRAVLVRAALSDVRAETITELRAEITHLRGEVEYYRSHGRGGTNGSGSVTPSNASTGSANTTSPPSAQRGLTWK